MLHFSEKDIPKRYIVSKIVGKGSYGAVAIAKVRDTDHKVSLPAQLRSLSSASTTSSRTAVTLNVF